ncbi:MAG: GAF domain-containing protein [Ardenticatenaceae bacterium]|nr:GAF domain-containing protein [Ardenticatenaceae bacterium]
MVAINEFIKPPVFKNEDLSRKARQLNAILLSVSAVLLVYVLYRLSTGSRLFNTFNLTLEIMIVVMMGLRFALHRGYVQASSYALSTISWLALAYLAWDADGVRDIAFLANVIVILICSLLLGWRAAAVFTALTIALGWAFAYGENVGILDYSIDSPNSMARDFTLVFIITAILIYLIINSLQQAIDRARQGEQELARLNSELEQRVQTRTQELMLAQQHTGTLLAELAEALRIARMANYELIIPEQAVVFSEQFFELLGTTAQAEGGTRLPISQAIQRFVHPEDQARLQEDIRVLGTGQMAGDLEYRLLHRNGDIRHFVFRFVVETSDRGYVTSVKGAVQDITERKQAEEALRQTEDIYRRAINSAEAVAYSRRYGDETFTFMGEKIYEMTGYKAEEITPAIFDQILEETIVYSVTLSHPEAVQQARAGQSPNWKADYRLRTRNGRSRWISDNSIEIRGADGNSVGSVGIMLDITERKETEAILARQATELETVMELATIIATISEPNTMLQTVVDLTKRNFHLYHAHIYLLNQVGDTLELTAGADEAGRTMTAQKHAIPLNREQSLVARAARTRQAVVVNDVTQNPDFLPNLLLPDTTAELAVPVIVGETLLGVLDVQSEQVNYFTEEEIRIQTILAAQIGVALQNARASEQTAQTLHELDALTRRLTREGWQQHLRETGSAHIGFALTDEGLFQIGQVEQPMVDGEGTIIQPVTVQGERIGQIVAADVESAEDEVKDILAAVSQGLSAHLENLRLGVQTERALAQAQHRTEELALINEVVSAVSASLDIQESLQIIVDEIVKATAADQARVLLLDEDRANLVVLAEHSITQKIMGMTIPVAADPLAAMVIDMRQTQVVDDPQHDPRLANIHHVMRAQGIEQLVIVPMAVGNTAIGTLAMEVIDKERRITQDELQLAETLAFQVTTAVENVRLFEQVQSRARQEQILREVTARVYAAPDAESVLKTAAQEVSRVLGVETSVYLDDISSPPTNGKTNSLAPSV